MITKNTFNYHNIYNLYILIIRDLRLKTYSIFRYFYSVFAQRSTSCSEHINYSKTMKNLNLTNDFIFRLRRYSSASYCRPLLATLSSHHALL